MASDIANSCLKCEELSRELSRIRITIYNALVCRGVGREGGSIFFFKLERLQQLPGRHIVIISKGVGALQH